MIKNHFEWLKGKIKEHKYKILGAISFISAGYLFYCYVSDDKDIKLSQFLTAL